ncbi:MAG: hypothetical protein LW724_07495 [Planctomycetaceae bacterium]|jgi:hypothetical protein|nr:hypothetical protein [Planctomycetaceae bacterium]
MAWLKLIAGCLMLGLLWVWVLPQIAKNPAVKKHIEFLEDRNINTGAMFYTEVQEHR